jgi:exopolyphosphatase/pppGpp-phosphohydrolase
MIDDSKHTSQICMTATPEVQRRTWLHIGEIETAIATTVPNMPGSTLLMPVGTLKTGHGYFKHDPPTPLEIEHAIEAVEDALAGISDSVEAGSILYTSDPRIGQIAKVAGIGHRQQAELSRELVERTFDRLVALATGRPITQDAIPTDPEFAAVLLILREFMQHLQFTSIMVSIETS